MPISNSVRVRPGILAVLLALAMPSILSAAELFPLRDVRLLESPFLDAQQRDLDYILAHDPERFLYPFRREAGLETDAESYPNWEATGLDGHVGGHYLSALAQMAVVSDNPKARTRLDYMVAELARCQEAHDNGYIGGIPGSRELWEGLAAGKLEPEPFSLNGKWVPWYNLHKTFAGLRDAHLIAGNEQARTVLLKLADWCVELTGSLDEKQMQAMLRSEHGGMNEVFADLYAMTGETRYLEAARRFSHREILDPLLAGEDTLTGMHANTQIPKVVGFARYAEVAEAPDWGEAARFFWKTVVENRSVAIGGNSVKEHFHSTDDFRSMMESEQGPETCNTYNMLRLTELLFQRKPEAVLTEYYERALYNHILSSQHPEQGGFVYFTPMRLRHYRVYSQPEVCFWCCVGSGMENHGKYGRFIYAHEGGDTLYVNLFIPSVLRWEENGLLLRQGGRFPSEPRTRILVEELDEGAELVIRLRRPSWAVGETFAVRVNDEPVEPTATPGSYLELAREWKAGDLIEIDLPMGFGLERLPDGSAYAAITHGPLVLAAPVPDGELPGLFADDGRMAHIAGGSKLPLETAPSLAGSREGILESIRPVPDKPLHFTAADALSPDIHDGLVLKPFFQVHDTRYMIYWKLSSLGEN